MGDGAVKIVGDEASKIMPVVPERTAIAWRMESVGEEHTLRGVPFMGVHAALRRYRIETETIDELCNRIGAPAEPSLMTKYPMRTFLEFEQAAAELLEDHVGGFDAAVFLCGSAAIEVFFETLAGRTMKALAGKNPHRLLGSVPNGYQLLASFGKRSYQKTGPTTGRFDFQDEFLGAVHSCGIFDAAFRVLHGLDVGFSLDQRNPTDFSFDLSW